MRYSGTGRQGPRARASFRDFLFFFESMHVAWRLFEMFPILELPFHRWTRGAEDVQFFCGKATQQANDAENHRGVFVQKNRECERDDTEHDADGVKDQHGLTLRKAR